MAGHNVLSEMGRLHLTRPAADAAPVVLAGWYERKAAMLEHLTAAGVAGVAEQATRAHEHAAQLLAVA